MKQLAIIGPTASGKSDLALSLAQEYNAVLLSIDSLSIYQDITIASAKPSDNELDRAVHFGINILSPDKTASVFTFIDEYTRASLYATTHKKNLIIVGGSSFYLKSMLEGLSYIPPITDETKLIATKMLTNLDRAHALLTQIDPEMMAKIMPTDAYRIEKMLHLYLQTKTPPSAWFHKHPPKPIIHDCPIINIDMDRSLLRDRIVTRTQKMIATGLIDEVAHLEQTYGRAPNSMKSIGIIETLEFLDGKISKETLKTIISTHTAQLAKRQQTFNTHQFQQCTSGLTQDLYVIATEILTRP